MPIYEYECRECGQRFERMQSFQDEPIRVCPHCGGETRRVFHPVGVIFKGSGWYITDSRKSSSESVNSAPSDGDKAGKTESASGKDGESKSSTPAAKDSAAPATTTPKAGGEA